MTTITIQIPGKAGNKDKISALVKELGGEIVSVTAGSKNAKKQKLLDEIKQGLKEVKDIQEGKAKAYSMSDLFDGE